MKVHITVNDMNDFDKTVEMAKQEILNRGKKKSGKIIECSPHVEILPHGGAEFDGETFDEYEIGSWRIGRS